MFFAVASGMNDADCKRAMTWFRQYLFNGNSYADIYMQLAANSDKPEILQAMSDYANAADVGIDHVEIERDVERTENAVMGNLPTDMPDELRSSLEQLLRIVSNNPEIIDVSPSTFKITSLHRVIDTDGNSKLFPLDFRLESDGTRNLMALAPAIVRVLDCGGVLLMDELEKGLPPLLVKIILSRFQSPKTNPKNAQLIFTTHSAELLDMSILRKDQIYLADKDRETSVSSLYSVSDFSTPTRENVRKAYLAGKYGASPDIRIEEVGP